MRLIKQDTITALDKAIVSTVKSQYDRITEGKNSFECAFEVGKALEALRYLGRGKEPDYNDEWIALFYLTWYQGAHINLACEVVRKLFSCSKDKEKPINIIDFGCGTLAVKFALAIYMAETGKFPDIVLDSIDPSKSMRNIGKKMFKKFWHIVEEDHNLPHLAYACDRIFHQSNFGSSYKDIEIDFDRASKDWLILMHAVYESNKYPIKSSLEKISDTWKPEQAIITSHSNKLDLIKFIVDGYGRESEVSWLECQELNKTTKWRKMLYNRLENCFNEKYRDLASSFLRGTVTLEPSNPVIYHLCYR